MVGPDGSTTYAMAAGNIITYILTIQVVFIYKVIHMKIHD